MKISTMKEQYKNRIFSLVFWIVFWWTLSSLIKNPILLPNPISVLREVISILTDKNSLISIYFTSIRIVSGLLIAIFVGVVLGLISYKYSLLKNIIDLPMDIIRSTPLASITIILLIWISHKSLSSYIVALVVIPNIYTSMLAGLRSIDIKLLEMKTVFKVPFFKSIKYIYIGEVKKALIPSIIISIGMAFKSGISAEVLALINSSIGENIYYSKLYLDTKGLLAWTLIIIVLSQIYQQLIIYILRQVEK